MDFAISSALEKFISDRPQRPQRKLFDGAAVQRVGQQHASVSVTAEGQHNTTSAPPLTSSAAIRGLSTNSQRTSTHAAVITTSPHHQKPPTRRRSPSPPKQPDVRLPDQLLNAEHSASSGQGCRHVLATSNGLPGSLGGVQGPAGQRGSNGSLHWLTPRGHDVSGVFKLLQRPTMRSVRHAAMMEEAHHDLLITLVCEGGTIAEDGKSLASEPLGLKWLHVLVSQHPRQGFLRIVKADRPVPLEIVGSHSYFQMQIPGTLVGDYVKLELAGDDPTRMMRIVLVAFSQASTVTIRQKAIMTSPSRREADDEPDDGVSTEDEASVDSQDADPVVNHHHPATSSGVADHDVLDRTATPRRTQNDPASFERSVLVDLSPPPPTTSGEYSDALVLTNRSTNDFGDTTIAAQMSISNAQRRHRNNVVASAEQAMDTTTTAPLATTARKTIVIPSSGKNPHPQKELVVPSHTGLKSQHYLSTAQHREIDVGDDHTRNGVDRSRSLRDVIVEYTKQRVLDAASDTETAPHTAAAEPHHRHTSGGSNRHQSVGSSAALKAVPIPSLQAIEVQHPNTSSENNMRPTSRSGSTRTTTSHQTTATLSTSDESLLQRVGRLLLASSVPRGTGGYEEEPQQHQQVVGVPTSVLMTCSIREALQSLVRGGGDAQPAACRFSLVVYCGQGDWRRSWTVSREESDALQPPDMESESFAVFVDATHHHSPPLVVMVCRSIPDVRKAIGHLSSSAQEHHHRSLSSLSGPYPPTGATTPTLHLRLLADDTPYALSFKELIDEIQLIATGPFLLYRLLISDAPSQQQLQQKRGSSSNGAQGLDADPLALSRYCGAFAMTPIGQHGGIRYGGSSSNGYVLRRYMMRCDAPPQTLWWRAPPSTHASHAQQQQQHGIVVSLSDENPIELRMEAGGYVGSASLGAALQALDAISHLAPTHGHSLSHSAYVRSQSQQQARNFIEISPSAWEEAVLSGLHHARMRCWKTVCIHVDVAADEGNAGVSAEVFDAWMDTIALWTAAYPSCIVLTCNRGVAGFPEECTAMFSQQLP